jgi:hypothetical protein
MQHKIAWYMATDILEESAAPILYRGSRDNRLFWNGINLLPDYTQLSCHNLKLHASYNVLHW